MIMIFDSCRIAQVSEHLIKQFLRK